MAKPETLSRIGATIAQILVITVIIMQGLTISNMMSAEGNIIKTETSLEKQNSVLQQEIVREHERIEQIEQMEIRTKSTRV